MKAFKKMKLYYYANVFYTNMKMNHLIVNEDVSMLFSLFHIYKFENKNILHEKLQKLIDDDYISEIDTILILISKLMHHHKTDKELLEAILIIMRSLEKIDIINELDEEAMSSKQFSVHTAVSTT